MFIILNQQIFQIAGLIAIALIYNPNCPKKSGRLNCEPLSGTPYAIWVSYLSVISSIGLLCLLLKCFRQISKKLLHEIY